MRRARNVFASAAPASTAPASTAPAWAVPVWAVLAGTVLAWVVAPSLTRAAEPVAGTVGASPAQELTQLADGTGRDLTVGRCSICHSLEYIPSNAPAMNRGGWEKAVQKMRDRFGAPITDAETRQILDYLATNYSGKP